MPDRRCYYDDVKLAPPGRPCATTLATPPIPCLVPRDVFDAFGWCASESLEWRRPARSDARWDTTPRVDGTDPARMVFVLRTACDFLPHELARLHAFGLHLEDELALAPWAIDDATDRLYERGARPSALLWLAADNLNALFWGLHDWAHFHNHGPFERRAWTELQCDASALAWLWLNRRRIGVDDATWTELARQAAALSHQRFASEEPTVSRGEVDDVLTRARQSLCSFRVTLHKQRGRQVSTETTDSLLRTVARRPT